MTLRVGIHGSSEFTHSEAWKCSTTETGIARVEIVL